MVFLARCLAAPYIRARSKFPFAAYPWTLSPLGLQGEYDRRPCKHVLGAWLQRWCEYWQRVGGLDSRGAAADFKAITVLLQEEMGRN